MASLRKPQFVTARSIETDAALELGVLAAGAKKRGAILRLTLSITES